VDGKPGTEIAKRKPTKKAGDHAKRISWQWYILENAPLPGVGWGWRRCQPMSFGENMEGGIGKREM
jgi:hypothetical protein